YLVLAGGTVGRRDPSGYLCPRLPDKHVEAPLLPDTKEGRGGTSTSLANPNGKHPPFREAANQGDVPMKLSQIAAAAVAFLAGSASEAAQVWTAPAAVKVRPQAQPPQGSSATAVIAAAKNEFESFQVVVTGPAADADAGVDQGPLNVTGSAPAQLAVTLTVWDFAMPSTATLRSAFGMTWNGPCMGHGDGSCSNFDAEQKLRARYMQTALDNRIS